ncbi:hypothetical protein VSH64_14880 [Amycolatopsis rhabdoformis]|uniref:Sporulation protein n=1 Tax=Amycolatopsis rhabdoformis TaxID=1448059 RepID=A0ABZ1IGY7_9PSEU|nr:hypothetical protein [Amycolatopsis rhabdoformis]WSE33384.1 hypothetical protein VSH64_14880 [Amycolatopsis rhabdoformis]
MGLKDITASTTELYTASRVFGPPVDKDGIVVIPAAMITGGGGGGQEGPDKEGLGFGLFARPTGAFVIRGGTVSWVPAVDLTAWGITAGVVVISLAWILSRAARRKRGRRH